MNSRIALLLPSRGRPASLRRAIESISATAAKPEQIVVVVGVDEDDRATIRLASVYEPGVPVLWSIGAREKTLGRLWNRLADVEHGCDVLAMLVDDYVMATSGWDEEYRHAVARMPKGYGTAWPVDDLHVPDFCTAPVITRRMMQRMGFFVPPWFPFWFYDTWLEEMGAFVACRLTLAARIAAPDGRGSTLNMRDLAYWARLFEATRPMRMELASSILAEVYDDQPELKVSLNFAMQGVAMYYARRNAPLLDAAQAAALEGRLGARGEPDARYLATRADAEALITALQVGP